MRVSALPAGTAYAATTRSQAAGGLLDRDAGREAYPMLRVVFAAAPIAFGLDKFFNVLVDWPVYLAPWINDIAPGSG